MERDQRIHTYHVTNAALQGDASALCAGLADKGLRINPNQQRALRTYLAGCNVTGRVTIVRRTGWHDIDGHQFFVLPDETIGPKGSERVILNTSAVGPNEARGLLADWQQGVGALSNGHALPVLAISAALAGPLLDLAGQEGGGLNIFGGSPQGKTTVWFRSSLDLVHRSAISASPPTNGGRTGSAFRSSHARNPRPRAEAAAADMTGTREGMIDRHDHK
jgi:putative DNA primase/helicase